MLTVPKYRLLPTPTNGRAPYINGLVQEKHNSIANIFLALSLQYKEGPIPLNCAITKDNQTKIKYNDQFQVKNIPRNLQNTCFISLANQSLLGITTILHFCLFCVIAVALF